MESEYTPDFQRALDRIKDRYALRDSIAPSEMVDIAAEVMTAALSSHLLDANAHEDWRKRHEATD